MILVALPLSVLALAAGVYLLVKIKREFLSSAFEILAWLVIALSLVSVGFTAYKSLNRGCKKECMQKEVCVRTEMKTCHTAEGGSPACHAGGEQKCSGLAACAAGSCKMEGDSCVMEKEFCEKMIGKEACEAMIKERGRCVMSKEECAVQCKAEGKACCAKK